MAESVPEGYQIAGDRIINTKTKEWFFIRNRSFSEIDHLFRHCPSKLIDQFIKIPHEGKVKILDVGGGSKSVSSVEIAKKFGPNVSVINADLIAGEERSENFNNVQSDMFRLPFANGSFDLIYTRQVLSYFDTQDKNSKNFKKERAVLREIARTLKPGGVAIIDEPYFSDLPKNHPDIQTLSKELSLSIETKESGWFLSLDERVQRIINPEYFPPGHFLIMERGQLNPSIKKTLDKIPYKLPLWKSS
jgi:SAM-dependent methyltransferase